MPRKFISKFPEVPPSKYTKQEIFDKAVVHLLSQASASVWLGDTKHPSYGRPSIRGTGGKKDVVGIFITDSEYVPNMECFGTDFNRMFEAYECFYDLIAHKDIISRLDMVHDFTKNENFVEDIKPKLRIIADDFSLVIPNSIKEAVPSKKES